MSGFFKRSILSLKDNVVKAYTGDFFNRQTDLTIAQLAGAADLSGWITGSDRDIGGFSDAWLDVTKHGHAKFHGYISQKLPEDIRFKKSGYAMVRTQESSATAWDSSLYRYLIMRVKADNRKYFVNLKTETLVPTDIYQHILPIRTPGRWETIVVPFNEFTLTSNGVIVATQPTMSQTKMETVGFSISDKREGKFNLEFAWIKAVNSIHTFGNSIRLPYTPDITWNTDFESMDKTL